MLFILIYVVLVIVRPQEYPGIVEQQLPLLPAALICALIAWGISKHKSLREPQYPLLLAFLAIMMISEVFNGWAGGAAEQLSQFAPTVAAFVLLSNASWTQRRVLIVMAVMTLCACVLAAHSVQQATTGMGWTETPPQEDGRIQYIGIFSDPNDIGLLFVSVLPMAFYLSSRGGLLGLLRLFWLAAAALLLYGVYLTSSRGALLAVVFMAGVFVWLRRGMVTAALIGVGALGGISLLPSRLQEIDASESSAAGRVDAWYEGLQMFQSQPIFGVGAGNFADYNELTAHNSFVLVLAETGIVGFTVWMAFVGYCFWMMYTLYRHQPELPDAASEASWNVERALGGTLLVALCGFFAAAFFLSRSYVIILYFTAALVVGEYTGARRRFPSLPEFRLSNDIGRWLIVSIVSVIVLYIVVRALL
jgi:O-antigen ligase